MKIKEEENMSSHKTLSYYNDNARTFAERTLNVDFSVIKTDFSTSFPTGLLFSISAAASAATPGILQIGDIKLRLSTVLRSCAALHGNTPEWK